MSILLSDYPMEKFVETIPDFHNTPARYKQLIDAVENIAKMLNLNRRYHSRVFKNKSE